jgi:hypothetical protein
MFCLKCGRFEALTATISSLFAQLSRPPRTKLRLMEKTIDEKLDMNLAIRIYMRLGESTASLLLIFSLRRSIPQAAKVAGAMDGIS